MELPEFNGEGGGSRGVGGLPPDDPRLGGASENEDSDHIRAVLSKEFKKAAGESDTPPKAGQADEGNQPRAQEEQAEEDLSEEEQLKAKFRQALEKYGHDPVEMARATANAQTLASRATQNAADLQRRLDELEARMAQGDPRAPAVPMSPPWDRSPWDASPQTAAPQGPSATAAQQGGEDPFEDFDWDNPQESLRKVRETIRSDVRQEFFAAEVARRQWEEQNNYQRWMSDPQTQEKLNAYGPKMVEIYQRSPGIYQRMSRAERGPHLLYLAELEADRARGEQFYNEIKELDGTSVPGTPAQNGAAPGPGASRVLGGRTPSRFGTKPPSGDFGRTNSMKRLWNTAEGHEEDVALMEVLRERGHGDHLRVDE